MSEAYVYGTGRGSGDLGRRNFFHQNHFKHVFSHIMRSTTHVQCLRKIKLNLGSFVLLRRKRRLIELMLPVHAKFES